MRYTTPSGSASANNTSDLPDELDSLTPANPETGESVVDAAARENRASATHLLIEKWLQTAIADVENLHRGHLRVLSAFTQFVNEQTQLAWPSRVTISALTGLPPKTVSNLLLELRNMGYLKANRQRVPEAGNRTLLVYTFGNIDHDAIRARTAAITEAVLAIREKSVVVAKVPSQQDSPAPAGHKVPSQRDTESPAPTGQSRPDGTNSPAATGLQPKKSRQGGHRKRLSSVSTVGDSSLAFGAANAAPAAKDADASKRGTRLASDWRLPLRWGQWTLAECRATEEEIRREADKFADHWHAKPNHKGGAKLDWFATWRNWCRTAFPPSKGGAAPDARARAKEAEEDRKLRALL